MSVSEWDIVLGRYCKCTNFYLLACTVMFSQSTYSVNEDDGPAQPVLVLSNPSSTDITVQVRDDENTATGE